MSARNTAKLLAQSFVDRVKFTGMKGKERDAAALEFFLGAMHFALYREGQQSDTYGILSLICTFGISTRGYSYVVEVSKWDDE